MRPGTKYVCTIQRNCRMIEKKLSGHILFDDSIKSPQAIRRYCIVNLISESASQGEGCCIIVREQYLPEVILQH